MSPDGSGMRHVAGMYRSSDECRYAIESFVRAAVASSEPVLVAVPREHFPANFPVADWPEVTLADMRELGGNPARIIPALRVFAGRHAGRRVHYLGEPAWPGRPAAELRETARHEALLNVAFADSDVSILCLYGSAALSPAAVQDACTTHPLLLSAGHEHVSPGYQAPPEMPACLGTPLLAPAGAQGLTYDRDLRPVRALVEEVARAAGLSGPRRTDLVIAANEVAANTLCHTIGQGVIRLWTVDDRVLCQVEDSGHITDPLAGHWRPASDLPGGHGLWLVNQICDLSEIRTSELGTTIRLSMYRER
jgi:anti-sigma regulatory factor (Ser/Thr protein kinase)